MTDKDKNEVEFATGCEGSQSASTEVVNRRNFIESSVWEYGTNDQHAIITVHGLSPEEVTEMKVSRSVWNDFKNMCSEVLGFINCEFSRNYVSFNLPFQSHHFRYERGAIVWDKVIVERKVVKPCDGRSLFGSVESKFRNEILKRYEKYDMSNIDDREQYMKYRHTQLYGDVFLSEEHQTRMRMFMKKKRSRR